MLVNHILREGNKLAHYLANYALDYGSLQITNFHQLDVEGRKIINNDKLQIPYLRRKTCRLLGSLLQNNYYYMKYLIKINVNNTDSQDEKTQRR